MNQVWLAILLLMALGFVSYKAAKYYKARRLGYAIGMTILAVVIAYQIMAALYGVAPPAVTPPGDVPSEEVSGER